MSAVAARPFPTSPAPSATPWMWWFDDWSEDCLSLDEIHRLHAREPESAARYHCSLRVTYGEYLQLRKS